MSQISELAEICGVSEQAIRKFCRETFAKPSETSSETCETKRRNRWNLSDSQYEQVLSHYGKDFAAKPSETSSETYETSSETCETSSETCETASEPVPERRIALSAENEQWYRDKIDELTRMLNQEQQLHAATKAEMKALEASKEHERAREPRRLTWRERITGWTAG